jgi:hypothetical protein
MEITEEHVEYAVVQRLRDMLNDAREPYKLTAAYAFFTAILCWSAQRMRTRLNGNDSAFDIAAKRLWDGLKEEPITSRPWSIRIEEAKVVEIKTSLKRSALASGDFKDHTVARFIENLRNAVAHGDARNVRPFNHGGKLVGFEFQCVEKEKKKVTWSGKVVLLRSDMVRVADEIASRFCREMEAASKKSHLKADAETIKEAA